MKKPKLKIIGGQVELIRKSPNQTPAGYLWEWQRKRDLPNGTPIRIITDKDYQDLLFWSKYGGVA